MCADTLFMGVYFEDVCEWNAYITFFYVPSLLQISENGAFQLINLKNKNMDNNPSFYSGRSFD